MVVGQFRRFLDKCKSAVGKIKDFGKKALDVVTNNKDRIQKGIEVLAPRKAGFINRAIDSGLTKLTPILKS